MNGAPAARNRLAVAADFVAIAAITNHYIRTSAIHFGYEDVPAAELQQLWLQHADVYPWLVCEHSGDVLGYAKAGVFRARAAYRWITETGIYLRGDQCGRGLGGPLYTTLLAVLRAQGFHGAVGGIALPNDASVRLHERLGFQAAGRIPRAGRKFDRWHDVGFWYLGLQPEDHAPTTLRTPAAAFAALGSG
ncbi:MAG: N-acetyltransferase family protein [Planctomycetota bacterium]